jgi:hypothetical protein
MTRKRKPLKTAMLTVRLEPELLERVRAVARAEDRPVNAVARRALQQLVGAEKFVQPSQGIVVRDPRGRVVYDGAERRAK